MSNLINKNGMKKCQNFPHPSRSTFVLGARKNQIDINQERKIVNMFLSIGLITCFGCSKGPSHRHRDGSSSTHNICFNQEILPVDLVF